MRHDICDDSTAAGSNKNLLLLMAAVAIRACLNCAIERVRARMRVRVYVCPCVRANKCVRHAIDRMFTLFEQGSFMREAVTRLRLPPQDEVANYKKTGRQAKCRLITMRVPAPTA
jgi:hypothetical protein